MVNIGGYNLGIPSLGSLTGYFYSFFWGLIILVIIGIGAWVFWKKRQAKIQFPTPVTLDTYFENGTKKRIYGLRGGKFANQSGVFEFRVMIPGQRKLKELGIMPDYSKSDADGTLHFLTYGDGTVWQQFAEKLITQQTHKSKNAKGEEEESTIELLSQPVRGDVKTATVNSIKNFQNMIDPQKMTVIKMTFGAVIILLIAHLISLYIQTKIHCGA